MKIVIFGAGYVGTVTGACLAKCGHEVVFIEPNSFKVESINRGISPIVEPGLSELIEEGVRNKRLMAVQKISDELESANYAMIAVATPSSSNGELNLSYLQNVLQTMKESLNKRMEPLIVIIRSTIHPQALREAISDFRFQPVTFVSNPEFLRESTAIADFFNPPFTVAGGDHPESVESVLSLYEDFSPKKFHVSLECAALLKYACNAFHALKVAFANEMASICEESLIDAQELMRIFCEDETLNCSRAYLKPGFSFGGSCLPKDLRTLLSFGRELGIQLPLLSSILPSNQCRFQRILEEILENDHETIAVLGMSFKKNSDDLRESPFVALIEALIGKGMNLKIYDPDVEIDKLVGSNLHTLKNRFGHILPLIKKDLSSTLAGCDGVIVCKDLLDEECFQAIKRKSIRCYDVQYIFRSKEKREQLSPI